MEKQTKKGNTMNETLNTTQAKRNFKAPAITLGTVMATTETEAIGGDGIVKQQTFNKMATRVGGPPRGPPPGGAKVGGAPKGPPPGAKGGKKVPGGPKGKVPGAPAASNANIPAAPAIKNYICFIKGEPFSGAAGAGDSTPAAGGDDLDLDAAADISAMLDTLDGQDKSEPFTVDEPTPEAKPAGPDYSDMGNNGGLAAELAAMALKLKSKEEAVASAPIREKREDEMSFAEQIAHQREKIRLKAEAEAAKAAEAEQAE